MKGFCKKCDGKCSNFTEEFAHLKEEIDKIKVKNLILKDKLYQIEFQMRNLKQEIFNEIKDKVMDYIREYQEKERQTIS